MRTTLTIDDDLIAKINAEMKRSGRSFKETVNGLLRIGISTRRELSSTHAFKVKAHDMGVQTGLNYANIGELLEQIDGPSHR